MKRNFSATVIAITLSFVNIALFVFVLIATNLFTKTDLWFQSACVIIGTILTAVVTLLLLNGQSEKEEQKERNSKVFEEKLAIYKAFLDNLCNVVKDNDVSKCEKIELQFQVAKIAMHTNKARIDTISNSVMSIVYAIEEKSSNKNLLESLFTIQEQFRQELYPKEKEENWSSTITNFDGLEVVEHIKEKYSLSNEKIISFENRIKEDVQKNKDTNDFKNGFEITLSQNGNSKNFVRFARLNTERGEYCVQVWLNLLNIDERRSIYIKLKDKFQPSIYSANHCAQIYFDYVKDGKYRFIDTFASEIETLEPNTIDRFSKRIIEITNFVEEQLKNKE